eukprot:TRINITY_DN2746_c0_g1_i2.p1 TRINITY_DN2746_c0_g1~~TRINITY_DN2746_c0_g1_i2.p1  ORF type:complete len:402 (-),score=110.42 TRINITY_DN2746_c0_g1_i2:262-1467(-)
MRLAQMIRTNETLLDLVLTGNDLGIDGARALVDAAESSTTLQRLLIDDELLDEGRGERLHEILHRNLKAARETENVDGNDEDDDDDEADEDNGDVDEEQDDFGPDDNYDDTFNPLIEMNAPMLKVPLSERMGIAADYLRKACEQRSKPTWTSFTVKLLGEMAADDVIHNFIDHFLAKSGVEVVLKTMETFARAPAIQRDCCHLIARLAVVKAARQAVLEQGGVRDVVRCMRAFAGQSKQLEQMALAALCGLGVDPESWAEFGVIEALLPVMKRRVAEAPTQTFAIEAMMTVAQAENGKYLSIFDEATVKAVHEAMSAHPKDPRLQTAGCRLLAALAERDEGMRKVTCECMPAVMRLFESFRFSDELGELVRSTYASMSGRHVTLVRNGSELSFQFAGALEQ